MFGIYSGEDLMNLPTNDNHIVYRWTRTDCKILFSMTRRGRAAVCHFASDKRGLRMIKEAINTFFYFIAENFGWCKMAIAVAKRPSVKRVLLKSGFETIYKNNGLDVMGRKITWAV